jgi:hypothetical protein
MICLNQTLLKDLCNFMRVLWGGIDRMTGRRTEQLSEVAVGVTTYTDNKRILENNSTISVVGGFLWKFPPLPILMGPEVYFGRGNAMSSVTATTQDGVGNRYYSTDFQRKFFYGGLIRVGYLFCPDLLGSLSLGIDRSQFLTKRTLATNLINRTKGFNGVSFGCGLEKHFGHFGFGLDVKLIQYRRQRTTDPVTLGVVQLGAVQSDLSFSVRPIIYSAALRFCYLF